MSRPVGERYTVACDFDGVIHSYTSPWVNAHTIPDPPVPGAIEWLYQMATRFDVVINSTRCKTWRGQRAVRSYIYRHFLDLAWVWCNANVPNLMTHGDVEESAAILASQHMANIRYEGKPTALVYIDDRAWRFEGTFPTVEEIHRAKPWNKR